MLTSDIKVFDPPTAYQSAYQQPTGSRFGGDALFNGENRDSGALIKFYFQKKEDEKDEEKEDTDSEDEDDETEDTSEEKEGPSKDSIYLKIYDDSHFGNSGSYYLLLKSYLPVCLQPWTTSFNLALYKK